MTPAEQFLALYRVIVPMFNIARDQYVAMFNDFGLQTPISDPDSPSSPGASYLALDNETRVRLHSSAIQVSEAAKLRATI